MKSHATSNQAMELTATRRLFTLYVTKPASPLAMPALGSGSSSLSR